MIPLREGVSKLTTLGLKKKGGTIGVLNRAGRPVTQLINFIDKESAAQSLICCDLTYV